MEDYDPDTFFNSGKQIAGVHNIVTKLVSLIQGIFSIHSSLIQKMICKYYFPVFGHFEISDFEEYLWLFYIFSVAYDHSSRIAHVTTVSSSYEQVRHQLLESLLSLGGNLCKLEKGEVPKTGSIRDPLPTHAFSGLSSQMAKVSANIVESVSFLV